MLNSCFRRAAANQRRAATTARVFALVLAAATLLLSVHAGGGGKVNNDELYKLLEVSKTATTKEIRVAFKKIALIKHPDKNPEDPNANEHFIKINRAYEILKDDELRKKYDAYGEEGLKDDQNHGHNYQSWNFYKQNFGIYDDDPEVTTLSRADFMQSVESNTDTIWFVNFYSTQCSHCHDLAPTWRELAKQLDGVVRIGAVNCMDDWMLCNQQQIQAFPSLIMYPRREKYNQAKTYENLLKFALSFANGQLVELNSVAAYHNELARKAQKPWLVSFCLRGDNKDDDDEHHSTELNYELNCLDELVKKKLAIMLHGLVRVGSIECANDEVNNNICQRLSPSRASPIVYYPSLPDILNPEAGNQFSAINVDTTDYKQIVQKVLGYLPDVKELDEETFKAVLSNLRDKEKKEKPWLIQFVLGNQGQDLELKKLPSLLTSSYNFAKVDCLKLDEPNECFLRFQITKYPTFILFKSGSGLIGGSLNMEENWYEVYYNSRQSPQDLASFVKENAHTTVRTLTKFDRNSLAEQLAANGKLAFFVDFFAPWCPPCMNLLPEFRKASKLDGSRKTSFGTIDCTVNQKLCEQNGVTSYPTTILFNNSAPFTYFGQHFAEDISDFIQDIIKPTVVTLNYESFSKMVQTKPVGKVWLVDFYASWCGPCQQLAPEWRKLSKKFDANVVSVGQVDCVVEQRLCSEQGIHSYPNIRAYPATSKGTAQFQQYQGWSRDVNSLFQWASDFLPKKSHTLDYNSFERLVLKKGDDNDEDRQPWLIDFYAPWCGHCHVFSPKFEIIAEKLEGKVKCGKVNCQEQQFLCQRIGLEGFPSIFFYQIPKSEFSPWNSGEDIRQYEVDSVLSVVNDKLRQYGYKKKKASADKATVNEPKTEL